MSSANDTRHVAPAAAWLYGGCPELWLQQTCGQHRRDGHTLRHMRPIMPTMCNQDVHQRQHELVQCCEINLTSEVAHLLKMSSSRIRTPRLMNWPQPCILHVSSRQVSRTDRSYCRIGPLTGTHFYGLDPRLLVIDTCCTTKRQTGSKVASGLAVRQTHVYASMTFRPR